MPNTTIIQHYVKQILVYHKSNNPAHPNYSHFKTWVNNHVEKTIHSAMNLGSYNGSLEKYFFNGVMRNQVVHPKMIPLLQVYVAENKKKNWRSFLMHSMPSDFDIEVWLNDYQVKLVQKPVKKVVSQSFVCIDDGFNQFVTNFNHFLENRNSSTRGFDFENAFAHFLNLQWKQEYKGQKLSYDESHRIKLFQKIMTTQKQVQTVLNRATKSVKVSDCFVNELDFNEHYKTDVLYRNKNRAFTRISLKSTFKFEEVSLGRSTIRSLAKNCFGQWFACLKYNKKLWKSDFHEIFAEKKVCLIEHFMFGINRENIKWLVVYCTGNHTLKLIHYKKLMNLLLSDDVVISSDYKNETINFILNDKILCSFVLQIDYSNTFGHLTNHVHMKLNVNHPDIIKDLDVAFNM